MIRDISAKPANKVRWKSQPLTPDQIEPLKGSYRDAIRGLNDLADTLRQIHRDQKSSEREVQTVRTMLAKLQSVRV